MEIKEIYVPEGIEYISNWKEYQYPEGKLIVDKGVTGCGYTEFCLMNSRNIVLCSPRKLLLANKMGQHKKLGHHNILYLENNIKDFQGVIDYEKKIINHISSCEILGFPCKFMITYDSMYHLISCLKKIKKLNDFSFVVDEFQSIFLDAYFKAEVEFDFVEYLKNCKNVIFLSATPMMEKYLAQVDEFKNLPCQKINWSKSGFVEFIKLKPKIIKSISEEFSKIIEDYKIGNYPMLLNKEGKIIKSTELVGYVNSVTEILKIIKKTKITPREVNIICSDTPGNKTKLNKLSKDLGVSEKYIIGHVPLPGEQNKPFTLCTSTVYIGADFYSECASTYVFSDPNIECLALDIALDLPQIVGRQRNKNNPFKNNINIYYRFLGGKNFRDLQEFIGLQRRRDWASGQILDAFLNMSKDQKDIYRVKLISDIKLNKYSGDFISISSKTGEPVYNNFIKVATERAWEVIQIDYQDQISVTKAIDKNGYLDYFKETYHKYEKIINSFLNDFFRESLFDKRLKLYCEFMDFYNCYPDLQEYINFQIKETEYQKYYQFFGTSGCKAQKFRSKNLKELFETKWRVQNNALTGIIDLFEVGKKYTLKDIKEILGKFYQGQGVRKTPKAIDLKEYFEVQEIKIYDQKAKKQNKGYKILGLL